MPIENRVILFKAEKTKIKNLGTSGIETRPALTQSYYSTTSDNTAALPHECSLVYPINQKAYKTNMESLCDTKK